MAILTGEEALSIVQFLRLIDRNGIGQPRLVIHMQFLPPGAEHSTTWLPAWTSQGLISDREKLGQLAIGIVLYQGPMDTSWIRPTIYPYNRTIV